VRLPGRRAWGLTATRRGIWNSNDSGSGTTAKKKRLLDEVYIKWSEMCFSRCNFYNFLHTAINFHPRNKFLTDVEFIHNLHRCSIQLDSRKPCVWSSVAYLGGILCHSRLGIYTLVILFTVEVYFQAAACSQFSTKSEATVRPCLRMYFTSWNDLSKSSINVVFPIVEETSTSIPSVWWKRYRMSTWRWTTFYQTENNVGEVRLLLVIWYEVQLGR
jgi:hypothetical protein